MRAMHVLLLGGPLDGRVKPWGAYLRWLIPYVGRYELDFTHVTASWVPEP